MELTLNHNKTQTSAKKDKNSFFSFGHDMTSIEPFFQTKLTINQPNDVYEQEADAVADKVMRMSGIKKTEALFFKPKPLPVTQVQTKCAACEHEGKSQRKEDKEDEEPIQLKPAKEFEIQRKCDHCEEEKKLQRKESNDDANVMIVPGENKISSLTADTVGQRQIELLQLTQKNSDNFFSLSSIESFFNIANIQPKLTINQPHDIYEQEADAIADKEVKQRSGPSSYSNAETKSDLVVTQVVTGMQKKCTNCEQEELQKKDEDEQQKGRLIEKNIFDSGTPPAEDNKNIQRICSECECEEKIQERSISPLLENAPRDIESSLNSSKGSGSSLPATVRKEMEDSFGTDFSGVRIHTDSTAVKMNKDLHAKAFTHDEDIYFNSGEYDPSSFEGRRLLAHELTHTIQQGAVSAIRKKEDYSVKISHQTGENMLQCACTEQQLTEGLDRENLSEADQRIIARRIRECASEDVNSFRNLIASYPPSPADAEQLRPEVRQLYTEFLTQVDASIISIQTHTDEPNRRIRLAHLQHVADLARNNKLIAYYVAMSGIQNRIQRVRIMGDINITATPENLQNLAVLDRSVQQDPLRFITSNQEDVYYNRLHLPRLQAGESAFTGPSESELEANAPAIPAQIVGANVQVRNATGTYTMRLNYAIAGPDLLSQVAEARNWVNYRWEFYDITTLYQQRIEEQIAHLRAREESAEGLLSPASTGPSATDVTLENMRQQAPSQEHQVGQLDAAGRRWQRYLENQIEDFENNVEDLADPAAGSNGTLIDNISTSLIAEFNLANTVIAAAFGALAELLSTFSDLLGGTFYEKEIPFPNRDGWFLIRCIAQPSPQGDEENPVIRPASVATKVVRARAIQAFAAQELQDLDTSLEARRIELETNLRFITDAEDRRRLEAELAGVRTEMTGTTVQILQLRIDQLNALKTRTTNILERQRIDAQIRTLEEQLRTATLREAEMITTTILRPRAVFVSEETSQTYPLLLQLGQINTLDGSFHYKLSDVSNQNAGQWDGYGASIDEAVTRAFNQFARQSPYGRGMLTLHLPANATFTVSQTVFECEQRGGAMAIARLEQLVTVLTILGLMAVPGVGQAAAIIGAAIAAGRIISRILDHTFRWDTAAITDVFSILGAAASGAAAIGRMRVVRTARLFAVVADDADVVRLIQGLNQTASRLELVDEFLNWGGYMWGTMVTLDELRDIQMQEIRGDISHAEARRQRADHIASALRDGAFQFAGFRPEETSARVRDSFGQPDAPVHEGSSEPHSTDVTPQRPEVRPSHQEEPAPHPEEGSLPQSDVVPDSTTHVPDRPAGGPSPAEIQAQLGTLSRQVGELPASLRDLLIFDHLLLQRALDEPTLITRENVQAWNEIALLSPMHPDTYTILLQNPEIRRALLENPAAAQALKHCASPCFPPNASANDISALQTLIAQRTSQGLNTDLRALNEFLYEHRNAENLGDIIRMLQNDFDGTMRRQANTPDFRLPADWAEGQPGRPYILNSVIEKFRLHDLPIGLANAIFENLHALPAAEQINKMGDLNTLLSQRGTEGGSVHVDRILYGLSDPATFGIASFLLNRSGYQPEAIRTILGRLTVGEVQQLREGIGSMSPADFIRNVDAILQKVNMQNVSQILDLINRAGYPPRTGDAPNPDLSRLIELLNRQSADHLLSPAEVRSVIEQANTVRQSVAAGGIDSALSGERIRELMTQGRNLTGALLSHLNEVIIHSDAISEIVNQIIGEHGVTVDNIRFGEVAEVIREHVEQFIRDDLADQFREPLTPAQLNTLINRTWGPVRGDFYELVQDQALRRALGDNNVWNEVGVSVQRAAEGGRSASESTAVDNIGLVTEGNTLRVIFIEYKSGANTESGGQSVLREFIEGGGSIDGIAFDTPRSREISARIEAARRSGMTIEIAHRHIEENPSSD